MINETRENKLAKLILYKYRLEKLLALNETGIGLWVRLHCLHHWYFQWKRTI